MRCLLPALALAVLAVGPQAAGASPARAAQLKAEADAAFVAGDHARALALLQQAHAEDPAPGYVANQGVVLEAMGQYGEAVAAFERYLATSPPPAKRSAAEATVRRLRPEVVVGSVPAGAQVRFDGADTVAGVTPLRLRLVAGPHFAELNLTGHRPARPAFVVEPGEGTTLNVRLEPVEDAAAALTVPPPSGGRPPTVGYVSLGVGAVAAVAAVVLVSQAFGEIEARDDARSRADYAEHEDAANRLLGAGYGLGALSAIGVGVGAWWLWAE